MRIVMNVTDENCWLVEDRLRLITCLAVHADSKSRLINEFVKATGKKLVGIGRRVQRNLPLSA